MHTSSIQQVVAQETQHSAEQIGRQIYGQTNLQGDNNHARSNIQNSIKAQGVTLPMKSSQQQIEEHPSHSPSNQDTHISSRLSVSSHGGEVGMQQTQQLFKVIDADESNNSKDIRLPVGTVINESPLKVNDSNYYSHKMTSVPTEKLIPTLITPMLGKRKQQENLPSQHPNSSTKIALQANLVSNFADFGQRSQAQVQRNQLTSQAAQLNFGAQIPAAQIQQLPSVHHTVIHQLLNKQPVQMPLIQQANVPNVSTINFDQSYYPRHLLNMGILNQLSTNTQYQINQDFYGTLNQQFSGLTNNMKHASNSHPSLYHGAPFTQANSGHVDMLSNLFSQAKGGSSCLLQQLSQQKLNDAKVQIIDHLIKIIADTPAGSSDTQTLNKLLLDYFLHSELLKRHSDIQNLSPEPKEQETSQNEKSDSNPQIKASSVKGQDIAEETESSPASTEENIPKGLDEPCGISNKVMPITKCSHVNRKHYAKNMCSSCYRKYGRSQNATKCPHPDRLLYSMGMCQTCYLADYHKRRCKSSKTVAPEDNEIDNQTN